MNYNNEMKKQLENIEEGTKLLLHACCAPCSSAVLERLANFFEITIYYYNPNITDENEYKKRVEELRKLISKIKPKYEVSILEGEYEPEKFFEMSKGLEDQPERGKRCYYCYEMRIKDTARVAEKYNYPYFTTTLSLSPHKNADWINEIGKRIEEDLNTTFLYSDFKKENGYKRSIVLSKIYDLYRQDYCGCIYSKKQYFFFIKMVIL